MQVPGTTWRASRPAGFTMIELLVVIVVLALLIGLVVLVAAKAIRQQKVRNTQQLMQNVTLALEQFATENPLRAIYDVKDRATFGKFPPYQLENHGDTSPDDRTDVFAVLESLPPGGWGNNSVAERLWRDLGNCQAPRENWVVIATPPSPIAYPDGHDDARALYAYLKVFSPGAMSLIPEDRLKPIYPQSRSYVNPKGSGGIPGTPGATDWVDVLAVHDAWDVPLDYMVYVKCEWRLRSAGTMGFTVTEHKPVLRSRGIEREVYDAWVQSAPDDVTARERRLSPPEKWIFSEDLPKPWAAMTDGPAYTAGILNMSLSPPSRANGWVRAVGLNEDYAYRPDGDAVEP
jgi:prepilin-type N-terminal cleavage/methylation domain-containing protein